MRLSTGSRRRMPSSGSPRLSIRLVEFLMSANSNVRRLRSPPLVLSDRRMRCEDGSGLADVDTSAVPHCPQKRLVGPLMWLQTSHLIPRDAPQFSQKSLPALFWLSHREHCMHSPFGGGDRKFDVQMSI